VPLDDLLVDLALIASSDCGLSAPEMLFTICCMRLLFQVGCGQQHDEKSSRFVIKSA